MTNSLRTHHCVPCEGETAPLAPAEFSLYLDQVPDWAVLEDKALQRTFLLNNFMAAVHFISDIAQVAESEGHHPDLNLHDYKYLTITLTTHAIQGLSINDFVMAAKIDGLERQAS